MFEVEQNELVTGVLAGKAKILSSPVSENCRALLARIPVDKDPGTWASPVIGLYEPHRAFASIQDVTFVKNRMLSLSKVMLTPVLDSLVH